MNHPLLTFGNNFKERIGRHETLFGIFLYTGNTSAAEAAAVAGADFVIIDREASVMSEHAALTVIQTLTGTSCAPILRVPDHGQHTIEHSQDVGPAAIMVPHVETYSDATFVGEACRYHPEGTRGLNATRMSGYTLNESAYIAQANALACCIAQIETGGASGRAEEIASSAAIDALFVGTGDLALSLGCPGQPGHPLMNIARNRVLEAANAAGKPAGIAAGTVLEARTYAQEGFRFITLGNELKHFAHSLRSQIAAARPDPVADSADTGCAPRSSG